MKFTYPIPNFIPARYPKGSIIQGWGENVALYETIGLHNGHNGWDIVRTDIDGYGSPLLATTDGTIIQEGINLNAGGREILLQSPFENGISYITAYYHCSNNHFLDVGAQVKAGDKIGEMGNSGFVVSSDGVPHPGDSDPTRRGTHLHFGCKKVELKDGQTIYYPFFDPNLIFNVFPMSNAQFVHKAGTQEYGYYLPAMSEDALKDKALNLGLQITKPDGTIDYTLAKDITL